MQGLKHKTPEEDEGIEQEPLTLGDQPIKLKCKFCAATMKTDIRFQNGVISYALCALAFITLPFFLAMIAIPLTLLLTKNLVHHCSCCNNQVGSDGKIIYALKYTDDVVTLKLGEMGCILTRKILLSVFLVALNIAVLGYKIHTAQSTSHSHKYGHSHSHDQLFPIESTWKEFFDDCNLNYLQQNGDPAIRHCFYKYIDKTISNWEGYVIRVEDLRGTLKQYIHHAVTILVLMDPTEQTEQQKFPDLQVTFDSELADQYSSILDNIDRGNHIGFNATIKSVGFEGQTRHLHVNAIWMLEGQKEIEAHVHHNGRYKDANKNIRGKNTVPDQLALPEIPQPSYVPENNEDKEQKQQQVAAGESSQEEKEKEILIEASP